MINRGRGVITRGRGVITFINHPPTLSDQYSPIFDIEANYKCIKQEILSLVASKIERIKNDANLKHLIKE